MKKASVFTVMVCVIAVANVALAEMDMTWVYINDPGVPGHESFTGYMSKYETTNAQYCQFLNEATASGDITIDGDNIFGASGSNSGADFIGQAYYNLGGTGDSAFGAANGGAARIDYSGGVFSVEAGFENHPVTYVSWYGATAFCNYCGYRLPTEWEWQAVADYDGSYAYGCGTSIDPSKANYWGSTHPDGTTVVGAFGAYGYEMADMAGNVFEWTSSLWARGGSWHGDTYWCEVSTRSFSENTYPDYWNINVGFRVACASIGALVDMNPDSLNTNSKGRWVTVYITLPEGYDVGQIEASTIAITSLAGESCQQDYKQAADLSFPPQIGDRDEDGIPDLTVKFDCQMLIANLCLGDVAVTVEGTLSTGQNFKGTDHIRVLDRAK